MGKYFVTSMMSGRNLPAEIIKRDKLRKACFMPWLFVEYQGTSLSQGEKVYSGWYYPENVVGYVA